MRFLTTGLQFPEGPIWTSDGSIILVEIARETLSRVTPDGRIEVIAKLPGGPNGAALGPGGKVYVCNNGGLDWIRENGRLRPGRQSSSYKTGSIDVVDLATGRVERLYEKCQGRSLRGPNDLVFDGGGGFWFTDMGKRRERDLDLGFIYWARADGSEIKEVIGDMITPNGIALSPDGRTLYAAETATGRIWSWEIIAPGEVRKLPWPALYGGTLAVDPGNRIRFDGLAISESGTVCAAALDQCAVLEFRKPGGDFRYHHVPDLMVTNLCFGGADMRTMYVTLSHGGQLLAMEWHEAGLQLHHHA